MLAEGSEVGEVAKAPEVSEQTCHRWRATYGGMKADEVKPAQGAQARRTPRARGRTSMPSTTKTERLQHRPR